jgi:hypothetical protein
MKLNIQKAAIAALAGLLLLPLMAFATVDYTPQDAAAVPMTAQTDLPQAGDQFCRAYRQLLVFDHDTYGANYNYNNLEGNLVAASVVLSYDNPSSNFATWTGVASSLANYALGYDDGTPKDQALAARVNLATSWGKIKQGYKAWADAVAECMAAPLSCAGSAVCSIGGAVSLPILLANPHVGAIVAAASICGMLLIAVICIAVGDVAFYNSVYGGFLAITPLFRRRRKLGRPA